MSRQANTILIRITLLLWSLAAVLVGAILLQITALAGFDWVSVANNHSGDHGRAGLAETLAALRRRGIASAGGGNTEAESLRPAVKTINGLRIALLAYDPLHATITASGNLAGPRWFDVSSAAADVRRARAVGAQIVIAGTSTGSGSV